MKKQIIIFVAVILQFAIYNPQSAICQNIGINTMGNAPNASAALDIDINQKGLLVPRMSTANRNAIVSPANSLLIFNTTTDCFEAWNQTTLTWVAFGCINCQLPGGFSTSAATSSTPTSFSANWTASAGATNYYLDVATDAAFTSFVSGYNNLNVGNVVTSSVTGLTGNTTYYYRVRASNFCGTSANSNVVTVTTCNNITATGGTITSLGGKTIHTFSAVGTFPFTITCSAVAATVEYLVVAGGGGGGNTQGGGGGGGAGGMRTGTLSVTSGTYTVTVGAGGTASPVENTTNGTVGGNSVFGIITSTGGGYGDGIENNGSGGGSGGSGGGGVYNESGGAGTGGQGSIGGNGSAYAGAGTEAGGGGGGAGTVGAVGVLGSNGGNGGNGSASSISGSSVTYAGGGGGGVNSNNTTPGIGGTGGGGNGGRRSISNATSGTANTGGGGGGGGSSGNSAGDGGSGIVIISYIP